MRSYAVLTVALNAAVLTPALGQINASKPDPAECYRRAAQRIIASVEAGNDAFNKLEILCDDIGHRLSGSEGLDRAIVWAVEALQRDRHQSVRTERVMVPKWVRGREALVMNAPRRQSLPMLGLGGSVGTPPEGICAPVISVPDVDALEKVGPRARGKIVLFDYPMPIKNPETGGGYDIAYVYRANGALWAAKHGAVACLVRSLTTRSLRTPHTGGMSYRGAATKIPAASVTTEDAAMITRLQRRGVPVTLTLKMEARMAEPVPSANVIAELRGREKPDEIVVISSHLDSWDVGQGAHDAGAGCVVAMEALTVLRKLGLIPRRTIRLVLWTNEENGLAGGTSYAREHADELPRHVAAIESDSGVYALHGIGVEHRDDDTRNSALARLREIAELLEPLGGNRAYAGYSGADVRKMLPAGVICIGLDADMTRYFDIHHTAADTLDKVDPKRLSEHVAAMAIVAYVIADMPTRLGR